MLPNFLVSFFVFGFFPIICNWMGLVISRDSFQALVQRRKQAEMNAKLKDKISDEAPADALTLDIK